MFEIKEFPLLKETIYETTLSNGLRLIVIPKKGFTKQFAMYATDYGSNNIRFVPVGQTEAVEVPLGIAHFLEHKMFDNPNGENVFEQFAKYGASPNAFTGNGMTAYYFVSTDDFYENLHILINYVNSPYFTHESVEKEKGIIGQEITMYDDMEGWVIQKNLLQALYHNHPVRNDIAGDIESISKITHEMLYLCYNNFYNPANMVLVTVGDIDPDEVLEHAEKYVAEDKRALAVGKVVKPVIDEPSEIVKPYVEAYMDVARPIVMYGCKDNNVGYTGCDLLRRRHAVDIALELFAGSESDFYNDMYRAQVVDQSFEYGYTGETEYAYAYFSVETEKKDEFLAKLKEYIAKTKKDGFLEESFHRVKKSFLGDLIRVFNNVNSIAIHSTYRAFNGTTLFDYYDVLNSITLEDVTAAFASLFDEEYSAVSVILPTAKEA